MFVPEKRPPTLSAVMPNYNHARYLAEAIEGIAGQSRPPDEFLILDDGSTDDSLAVIEPYLAKYPFIRLIRHSRNQGLLAAFARLFEEATCEYIFLAAADDIRRPGFFEQALDLAEQHPHAGLIFGQMGFIDEQGRRTGGIGVGRWQTPLYASPAQFLNDYLRVELASHSPICSTIFRADAFHEMGCYHPQLGSWTDYFAFRAIGLKYGVCYAPREFSRFRKSVGSFSHQRSAEPRKVLAIIAHAQKLMRTPPYADYFPPDYVRQWGRSYRRLVLWNDFLGDERDAPGAQKRASFLLRNTRRLARLPRVAALACYRPDVASSNAPS